MKMDEKIVDKDFYTTQELVKEPWFPIKSTLTVKKLIESKKIEAVDISTSPRFKRYRISKKSVLVFMEKQNTFEEEKEDKSIISRFKKNKKK